MQTEKSKPEKIDDIIGILLKLRQQAKVDKNYAQSDLIRQELEKIGVQLKDGKDGSTSYVL